VTHRDASQTNVADDLRRNAVAPICTNGFLKHILSGIDAAAGRRRLPAYTDRCVRVGYQGIESGDYLLCRTRSTDDSRIDSAESIAVNPSQDPVDRPPVGPAPYGGWQQPAHPGYGGGPYPLGGSPSGPALAPPGYAYGPLKRKKSKLAWILGGVGAVVVLCCGGTLVAVGLGLGNSPKTTSISDSQNSPGSDTTRAASKPNTATHPGLNQAARDGKFEFTVTKVTCGKATEGDSVLNKTAQGQFCEVAVTVKNIGTVPQTFDGSTQKAKGKTGVTYSDDGVAELYANNDNQTFLDEINPGNSVHGILVFDIPKDAQISTLELHDSMFSGGVTVTVG
jgi:hypothetical protein